MENTASYKSTVLACYIGNFVQAIVVNLTPIIFIPLREQYGFSYSQFGLLILINFITQVIADVSFSKAVDKYGFRPFAVAAHILCVIGFGLFVLTPKIFVNREFWGFLMATVVFSGAGGLLELLLSPIIDAIPTEEKAKAMAMLHSFYAWGQVTVVVVTTLCLFAGVHWSVIVAGWMVVPLVNIFLFAKVPLARKHHESPIMKIRQLLVNPIFIIAFFAIISGGAAEVTMAQWTSSFMQKGLDLPKIIGDMLGVCGFAVMLGVGRLAYGIWGEKVNLNKVLIYGSMLAMFCYLMVAISPYHWLSIVACAVTGICVSLLWPGTLVIAANKLPLAGASMFALLAAGGDIGASVGPWLTGVVTDFSMNLTPKILGISPEQFGLRAGMLLAAFYPMFSMVFHFMMRRKNDTP
jgi:fucose permease